MSILIISCTCCAQCGSPLIFECVRLIREYDRLTKRSLHRVTRPISAVRRHRGHVPDQCLLRPPAEQSPSNATLSHGTHSLLNCSAFSTVDHSLLSSSQVAVMFSWCTGENDPNFDRVGAALPVETLRCTEAQYRCCYPANCCMGKNGRPIHLCFSDFACPLIELTHKDYTALCKQDLLCLKSAKQAGGIDGSNVWLSRAADP